MEATTVAAATTPPRWYWIASGLAVLWTLFGVMALLTDPVFNEAALADMSEAQRQLVAARPGWLYADYAIATLGGLAGAIALLLRRAWAVPLLTLSLVAVVVQFGYVLFVMDAIAVLGAAASVPFPLVIFCIGALMLWLALHARGRNWLR